MLPVIEEICDRVGRLVVGKRDAMQLALASFIARGHLLIEDVPGVGKTLLAHTLAKTMGLGFSRIQFTSDLLPADIVGVNIFDRASGGFVFHPGPVFSQVLLADEINRASPKTQSALLEAMEERQVTVEGTTRPLPHPFFVIATQNPLEQAGTYPLPESQLDRFLMCISLGYPDPESERKLWREGDRREMLAEVEPVLDGAKVLEMQEKADGVHVAEPLIDYVYRLTVHTRTSGQYRNGLSPRAGQAIVRASRAWAFIEGRDYATPDDVQAVLPAVVGHRLVNADGTPSRDVSRLIVAVSIGSY